jgi:hypothetical protein
VFTESGHWLLLACDSTHRRKDKPYTSFGAT